MITFPCARCARELHAVLVSSEFACPCGASYEMRPMDVEGVSGMAILLGRREEQAAKTAACTTCGTLIGIGHIPPVALFGAPGLGPYRGGLYVVDQVGQRCPVCMSEVPVAIDDEDAPHWRTPTGSQA